MFQDMHGIEKQAVEDLGFDEWMWECLRWGSEMDEELQKVQKDCAASSLRIVNTNSEKIKVVFADFERNGNVGEEEFTIAMEILRVDTSEEPIAGMVKSCTSGGRVDFNKFLDLVEEGQDCDARTRDVIQRFQATPNQIECDKCYSRDGVPERMPANRPWRSLRGVDKFWAKELGIDTMFLDWNPMAGGGRRRSKKRRTKRRRSKRRRSKRRKSKRRRSKRR